LNGRLHVTGQSEFGDRILVGARGLGRACLLLRVAGCCPRLISGLLRRLHCLFSLRQCLLQLLNLLLLCGDGVP
jgi:hypothetical protein